MCFDHLSMAISCTYLDIIMMPTYDAIIGCGCNTLMVAITYNVDITITPMIVVTVLHERMKKVTITEFNK